MALIRALLRALVNVAVAADVAQEDRHCSIRLVFVASYVVVLKVINLVDCVAPVTTDHAMFASVFRGRFCLSFRTATSTLTTTFVSLTIFIVLPTGVTSAAKAPVVLEAHVVCTFAEAMCAALV